MSSVAGWRKKSSATSRGWKKVADSTARAAAVAYEEEAAAVDGGAAVLAEPYMAVPLSMPVSSSPAVAPALPPAPVARVRPVVVVAAPLPPPAPVPVALEEDEEAAVLAMRTTGRAPLRAFVQRCGGEVDRGGEWLLV